jgi:bifunctional DNA-binding transcriptional regulator/antitoxin component of YhaV-PrlF toxin-antitoxin module
MERIIEKIKPNREIELTKEILNALGIKTGEEVILIVKNRELLIKPARSIVDEVVGAAELEDTDLIDEIIEDAEFKE